MTDTQFPTKNFLQSATHFARKTSRIKQKPLAFGRLKKPPSIVDMSYYVTNENSFLDIKNAHLRVTGNVHTDVLKVGSIGFQPTGSNIPGTVNFTNVTTGVTTSSNLDVGGTLNLGTVELSASTHTLDHITARGNVTSTTVQFDNATTGLVTTANVEVGGELTVSSNIEVAGFVGTSGTGGLTVPSGTTGEQPTGVVGMIRYNTTVNELQVYNGTMWKIIGGMSGTGGTIADIGGYRIHTFTSDGTFTLISGGDVDYLVVAGGGGGGAAKSTADQYNPGAGGGGAGGVRTGNTSLNSGSYIITCGTGGSGPNGSASPGNGNKGGNSSIASLIVADGGGGGGKGTDGVAGLSGGCGGGAGGSSTGGTSGTGGSGSIGFGGGNSLGANSGGGGGGGMGSVGSDGSATGGGNGGNGIESSISGTSTYYAAGGGGGRGDGNVEAGGTGGTGGGGRGGGNGSQATVGTQFTGSGGGGGKDAAAPISSGADGGSGVVIIRYRI